MIFNPITRRFFLQGAGKSLLALPLLPSLIPKAYASTNTESEKFFVLIPSGHGGTGHSNDWYPAPYVNNFEGSWATQQKLFPEVSANDLGHIFRHAKLRNLLSADPGHPNGNVDAGKNRISYILGSFLNPYIDKMNFYVGIDGAMSYYGHSKGVYGGNSWFKAKDDDGNRDENLRWETIDQFLGRSNKFYKNRDQISIPVCDLTRDNSYLQGGVSTGNNKGRSIGGIYNSIFSKYENDIDPSALAKKENKQFLIDKVIEDYRRITKGAYGLAREIASEEKKLIEAHVDMLHETQKKYKTLINSCSDVKITNEYESLKTRDNAELYYDVLSDLLVAGFQCGANRIAMLSGNDYFRYPGDYHQEVAHAASSDPSKQLLHNKSFRWTSENLVANMVKKMDAVTLGNGKTILDMGMVAWVHESGPTTHGYANIGLTTFGSVDGFFNTGNFVDYRNMLNGGLIKWHKRVGPRPGVPLSRLLANIAQAYGHTPSDYRRFNRPGYGDSSKFNAEITNAKYADEKPALSDPYPKRLRDSLDDKLPIVT